jgi:hypothetical protein
MGRFDSLKLVKLLGDQLFEKRAKNRGKGGVQTDTQFETSEEHFKSSEREVFINLSGSEILCCFLRFFTAFSKVLKTGEKGVFKPTRNLRPPRNTSKVVKESFL